NYEESLKWFKMAAYQGDSIAQFLVGEMYENGQGTGKDLVRAYAWYSLAASGKYPSEKYIKKRNELEIRLTQKQRLGAESLIKQLWTPTN
ncbi:tetratricopeptide repeat protein, partial [Sedimenticola hydrogenitrophicus]|uniref:tetratricopeptide repeat protein n=1 Tax=Sedimenticola hydrogenitrophicus TaxID=2967975 RepID=UPI003AB05159